MTRSIAVALLVLLAVARGIGGVVLVLRGPNVVESDFASQGTARVLGLGLLVVSLLALLAAFRLLRKYKWANALAIAVTVVFVLDGMLNGYLLFGRPGVGGTVVNVAAAVIIIVFVLLSKRRDEFRAAA